MRVCLSIPLLFLGALIGGGAAAPSANQSITLIGNGMARKCEAHAKLASDRMMSPQHAVSTCTEALNLEALTAADRAATLNNRGVVLLHEMGEIGPALADFDAAIGVAPKRAESYINRGGILLRQERYSEAIVELEQGLTLGNLKEPWKAHYNRALAREALGDLRGARDDYAAALELKPDWEIASEQLARFSVRAR